MLYVFLFRIHGPTLRRLQAFSRMWPTARKAVSMEWSMCYTGACPFRSMHRDFELIQVFREPPELGMVSNSGYAFFTAPGSCPGFWRLCR
jgi:hypothetical protein